MKIARAPIAILILLVAAACGRQSANSSQAAAPSDDSTVIIEGYGRPSVPHDPRAMTAIDVATGDLSGLADYAGGRAVPPQVDRPGQSAVAILPAQAADGSVAAAQDGATQQTSPATPATTENTAADSDRANPSIGWSVGGAPAVP